MQCKKVSQEIVNADNNLDKFNVLDYFGWYKGNYWTYLQKYRSYDVTGTKMVEQKKNITVSVEDVKITPDYTVVSINGSLMEQNDKYGYLIIGHKIYQIPYDLIPQVKMDPCTDLVQRATLYSEVPFYDGQRMGDLASILRSDYKYCSIATKELVSKQVGDINLNNTTGYKITSNTAGDNEWVEFIPYLGYISLNYKHNGTFLEIETQLVKTNVKMK